MSSAEHEPRPENADEVKVESDAPVENAEAGEAPAEGAAVEVAEPRTLVERLELTNWAAKLWIELVEATAEPEALEMIQ